MKPEYKLKKYDETSMVLRIKLAMHLREPSKATRYDLDEAHADFEETLDRIVNPWSVLRKSKIA